MAAIGMANVAAVDVGGDSGGSWQQQWTGSPASVAAADMADLVDGQAWRGSVSSNKSGGHLRSEGQVAVTSFVTPRAPAGRREKAVGMRRWGSVAYNTNTLSTGHTTSTALALNCIDQVNEGSRPLVH